jgi:hypothetical protein
MLGKLSKVDIRTEWKNEAADFTKWLAQSENLATLSEEIGIDIKLIRTEASVGAFSADILAEEEETGRKIIIENQLESTDHDHLGKIITYGSGFDANILIWIFKEIREEHRQAIDWLNEKADTSLYIFAIRMELWRVNDSPPAPKFQVICSPNNWAKVVKGGGDGNLSETRAFQLDFWTQYSSYLSQSSKRLKPTNPGAHLWYSIRMGDARMHIENIARFSDDIIETQLYIPDNKELFAKLFSDKQKIEKDIGYGLEWEELPGKKASRIKHERRDAGLSDKSKYEECFHWYVETAEKFFDVFPKYA